MFANGDDSARMQQEDETSWLDRLKFTTIFSCIFLIVLAISGMICNTNCRDYDYESPDVLYPLQLSIINIQFHMNLFWDWKDPAASDVDEKLWKNLLKILLTPIVTLLIQTFVWTPIVTTVSLSVIDLLYETSEDIPDKLEPAIAVINFWITVILSKFLICLRKIYIGLYAFLTDEHI